MRFTGLSLIALWATSFAYAQENPQGQLRAFNAQVLQLRGVVASQNASNQSAAHAQAADALARRQQVLQGLMETAPARALELTFPDDILADLMATFPESAGTLEQHGVWQGILYYQIEDGVGFTTHKEIRKLKIGNELVDLFSPTETQAGSKCNEVIAASGVRSGNKMVVESSSVIPETTAQMTVACSTQGAQNVAVILVNFPGSALAGYSNTLPSNVTPAFMQGVFLGNAATDPANQASPDRSVSDSWTQASDGMTWVNNSGAGALTVAGPYMLNQTYGYCADSTALRTAAYAAANAVLDYTQFSRVVIVVPHNGSCNGTAGVGTMGCWSSECPGDGACNVSWTWWRADQIENRNYGVMLATHEMGHNLGLGHSGSRYHGAQVVNNIGVAGVRSEYNDKFATMGLWNLGFYAAPHELNNLSWMSAAHVQTVTGNGVYTIQGYDTRPAGVKALKVARGTGTTNAYFYIAYYPDRPNYLNALDAAVHGGAIIRYQDAATPAGKTDLLDFTVNPSSSTDFGNPVLPLGATWIDPYTDVQIQVSNIDTVGNTMTVTVNYTPPPCTPSDPTATFLTSSNTVSPGATANYTVQVTNHDSFSCSARNFDMTASLVTPDSTIGLSYLSPVLNVAPGATATTTLVASTTASTAINTYVVSATAIAESGGGHADATDVNASLTVQYIPPPATPTSVSAMAVFTGTGKNKVFQYIRFSWGAVPNAANYMVQRCKVSGKGASATCIYSLLTDGVVGTSIYDVPPAGTYRYQVKANNFSGSSGWSAAAQTTR